MTENPAPRTISTTPAATDEEAAAIMAAVIAMGELHRESPASPAAVKPTRWSQVGRQHMTRPFERQHEEW